MRFPPTCKAESCWTLDDAPFTTADSLEACSHVITKDINGSSHEILHAKLWGKPLVDFKYLASRGKGGTPPVMYAQRAKSARFVQKQLHITEAAAIKHPSLSDVVSSYIAAVDSRAYLNGVYKFTRHKSYNDVFKAMSGKGLDQSPAYILCTNEEKHALRELAALKLKVPVHTDRISRTVLSFTTFVARIGSVVSTFD